MPADIVEIAEAIVYELNRDPVNDFGRAIDAKRTNGDFEYKLEPGVFRVDVVPAGHPTSGAWDRSRTVDHNVACQIAIREGLRQRSAGELDNKPIDELRLVLQRIQKHFLQLELSQRQTAMPVSSEYEIDCDVTTLRQFSTYLGIVRVTYKVTD